MITRENYEEFFLLYTDNELSVQDRQAVERFVEGNTDLQEELNNLLQCKIKPEDQFVFANKDSLLRQDSLPADQTFTPNDDNYETYFLSYVDGELDETSCKAVEDYTRANPSRLRELQLLQQTVLAPDLAIVFDKKETLYKKEEKRRVIPMPWLRVAAAAAILLATGLYIFNTKKSETATTLVAGNIAGNNKVATKPLNGQTAGTGDEGDTKNHASDVTPATTDTLYHQGQDHRNMTTKPSVDMNTPNQRGSDLTVNSSTKQLQGHKRDAVNSAIPGQTDGRSVTGQTDGQTTTKGDKRTNRTNRSDGTELANAGSDQQVEQPAKVSVNGSAKQEVTDEQNNHPLNQIAARNDARDPKAPQGNRIPAEGSQQKGDGQGAISRENSSFATQALLNSENGSTNDGYASEEPASPRKNKLRGIFRRVSRVFEKTTNVDDEKHGVLIGSFQFALK